MRRVLALGAGLLLIAVAFVAASRVADTREGLIAEVVTLLSGLAGTGLLLYGLVPRRRRAGGAAPPPASGLTPKTARRSANDLVLGAGGLLVAAVLLGGLVVSAGWTWAFVGAVLLLPMLAGSTYLLAAFIRAPDREWRIDLQRLTGHR